MPLASGTNLGPYEILAPLGAGGMGEVYRARDTRLEREVAIKIIPAHLSSDPNLHQRLEREAKAVSKLSHPNICALYDIGQHDGTNFLVMELIEGETLEQRLTKGPLPSEQTIRCAAQIADALAKAHRKGFTHRDLKPSNIMLTKSGAKLMDFGLAKKDEPAPLSEALTEMTMDQSRLTGEGTIVGTLQYMAPEQLEGKEADARTDIFALGEVMYEMATGKPPFGGKSRASLIASIMNTDPPPMTQLQPLTPPVLEHVVRKCLAKDPDERWQNASDVASELNWILTSASGSQGAAAAPQIGYRRQRERAIWTGMVVALALLAVYLGWRGGHAARSDQPVHLTVTLSAGTALINNSIEPLAITPDGSAIVYAAVGEDQKTQLYLRNIDSFESTPIAGTVDASCPFFSPNGEWLAFFTNDGKMKKVLLRGGSPVVVVNEATGIGGAWGEDDTIYFKRSFVSGIYAIPAGGGQPREVTHTGSTADDRAHVWPKLLPGNSGLIFTVWTGRSFNEARIEALSFKTGKRKVLVEGGTDGRYLANGYLAFTRNGTLYVAGFDPERSELKGTPVPVLEGVMSGASNGDADFAVSNNGTLIYQPGTFTSFQRNLVWIDRTGKAANVTEEIRPYAFPAISPSGQRLALTLQLSSFDVWVYDLGRGTLTKASFGGDDYRPRWSPDGKMMAYDSSKSGNQQVYIRHGIEQGVETAVTDGPENKELYGWTLDGREIIFGRQNKDTGWDLYAAAVEGDHKPHPLVVAPFDQMSGRLSPDGKWLAYVSNESGQQEVFVQSISDPNERAQVSSEGGEAPEWARSSNELFFRSKTSLISVKITPGTTLNPGRPAALFEDKSAWNGYDVAGDGRFLVTREAKNKGIGTQINVVLHWFEEMKRERQK